MANDATPHILPDRSCQHPSCPEPYAAIVEIPNQPPIEYCRKHAIQIVETYVASMEE